MLFKETLPMVNSNIRILHALPTAKSVDIYVNGNIVSENLPFSNISNYYSLVPGSYQMQVYPAGTYDNPLLTQEISIAPSTSYTISIVSLQNNIYLFKLKDNNIPSTNISTFLRFMNLSPNSPLLSLYLPNNTELFDSVEYLETTGYYMLSSGIYNFQVSISSTDIINKYIKNVSLDNNKFYTIYIIGLFNDKPPLGSLLVVDS